MKENNVGGEICFYWGRGGAGEGLLEEVFLVVGGEVMSM